MSKLRQAVADGYAIGTPVAEIARALGLAESTIKVTAWRMGLRHPHQGRPRKRLICTT